MRCEVFFFRYRTFNDAAWPKSSHVNETGESMGEEGRKLSSPDLIGFDFSIDFLHVSLLRM
jgi:hypothetical protein